MGKHLSPTNVATYYHNQCHLYLHNAFHRPHDIAATSRDASPLAAAQFHRGLEWEARLFRLLEVSNQLVRLDPASEPKTAVQIRDLILGIGSTLSEGNARYVVNLVFQSPSFKQELTSAKSNPTLVAFGLAKPDIVKIMRVDKNQISWEIIDAKSSSALKSSHNAQIGFYHLCLENLIASVAQKGKNVLQIIPSNQASIWLPGSEEDDELSKPVSTPISLLLPPLRTFLFKTLPQVLKLPRDQVEWHLNPSCQGCEFFTSCKQATIEDGRLGLIPNLSVSEARFIREVMGIAVEQGFMPASTGQLTDIEEMDSLVKNNGIERLEKTYTPTAKRFQRLLGVQRTSTRRWSPLLEAAKTHEPQLTGQRVFTFPRGEEFALYISVIIDVSSNTMGAFCLSCPSQPNKPSGGGLAHIDDGAENFVPSVAKLLRKRLKHDPKARTQVYTYSPAERSVIMSHLIQTALSKDSQAKTKDIRLCLGALCEGTSLLLTTFQPQILSGVLLSFLSKKNNLKKDSLQVCCQRLGLDDEGTVDSLRKRIETEHKRLAEIGGRAGDELHRREVGQLGKVVVLKREIERLISLPIPGYVDLPQTAELLLAGKKTCKSDDVLFGEWTQRDSTTSTEPWVAGLRDRNRCMRALVNNVRQRIRDAGLTEKILLNEAKALEVGMMDICESDKLRKLMFMLQFEVVIRLQVLWQDRLDGCQNAPLLRYVGAEKKGSTWYSVFNIESGNVEPPVEDRHFYDWLLVEDQDVSPNQMTDPPPEIYFDDLSLSGLFFPLNRFTKPKWEEQHPIVKENIFIANITDIRMRTSDTDARRPLSQAMVQTYFTGKALKRGALYRMSPRLVDFNLTRVLQNLVTMDFQESVSGEQVPFVELITYLDSFTSSPSFCGRDEERKEKTIVRGLNDLERLGNEHARALVLKRSQHRAAMRMMLKRLSVVWGPPGTGKTYTLALSTLRMIEVLGAKATQLCPIILVTAMTHAAIEAIFGKINSLIDHYRALKERDASWLDTISLERVFSGATHSAPKTNKVYIYAGTTYQLFKFCERVNITANVIIIDEAGQLALGTAALVIRWLSQTGKLVLAGDHQQLAPILGGDYPEPPEELPLFGSVLDMLMGRKHGLKMARTLSNPDVQSQDEDLEGTVVQLLENFRLNEDLGAFVEIIYAKKFQPQKSQKAEIAESLTLWLDTESSDDPIMEEGRLFLLDLADAMLQKTPSAQLHQPRVSTTLTIKASNRPASLALVRVDASGSSMLPYEAHVKAEARLAAALVHWLRESFGDEESIFVACPHRIQRSAVRQAILSPGEDWGTDHMEQNGPESDVDALAAELTAFHVSERGLRIDTVERLQGSEASFVIFLMSHTHAPSLSNHLEFLLSRRRLNVGISRAKVLCIMISSRGVLQPSLEVLAKEGSREGLEFLRAYEDRAWIKDVKLEL